MVYFYNFKHTHTPVIRRTMLEGGKVYPAYISSVIHPVLYSTLKNDEHCFILDLRFDKDSCGDGQCFSKNRLCKLENIRISYCNLVAGVLAYRLDHTSSDNVLIILGLLVIKYLWVSQLPVLSTGHYK